VEALGYTVGRGNVIRDVTDDLLAILLDGYREADGVPGGTPPEVPNG